MGDKLQDAINALRATGLDAEADAVEELRSRHNRTMDAYHASQRASYAVGFKDGHLKCGHHQSLAINSAETGEFLYCDLCDAKSRCRDAEAIEAELRAALAAQQAEPDEQEVALQEIAEFGQDQLREPRTQEEKEQYAFEDWLASECPSGDVESVQRQWEESAEYLELQDATPAQPADAQPTGQSPCARHCEAPAFEGEIRRLKREATIKDSLTIRPPAPAAVPPGYALVPVEPTPEMVAAYLDANTKYWRFVDEQPPKVGIWRNGTPAQATEEAYRAMIAAAGDKP